MTIYLSAPISGVRDNNKFVFQSAETYLVQKGYTVINPLKLGNEGDWVDCMIRDLRHLKNADAILMLPEWQTSYGCKIEYLVALKLGIPVVTNMLDL